MNIVADENIALPIVERLQRDGHFVWYTTLGRGISDDIVLGVANQQKALLLTDDKDFGELVIRHRHQTSGVVLLRLAGVSPIQRAEIVAQVFREHGDELIGAFTIITPRKVRINPIE